MSLSTLVCSHLQESQFTQYNTGPNFIQSLLSVETQATNNVLPIFLSVYMCIHIYVCSGAWGM